MKTRIAVVAPSGPVAPESLERGMKNLSAMHPSCEFVTAPNLFLKTGFLAGADEARLDGIRWAFMESGAEIVWIARGGFGATRIADKVDWGECAVRSGRAALIGYSDATAALTAYAAHGGRAFHGPMLAADLSVGPPGARTRESLEKLLFSRGEDAFAFDGIFMNDADSRVEGIILAGNLTVFAAMCGTTLLPADEGRVIFLEDVNEEPYRLERCLVQLAACGFFERAAGVVFGDFSNCVAEKPEKSFTVDEVLSRFAASVSFPVIRNFPFGHRGENSVLPLNGHAALERSSGGIAARIRAA